MTTDLKDLMERAKSWPEAAQHQLVAIAKQIESELQDGTYVATQEELQIIDAAMASIDAGESVSPAQIKALFAKHRRV